MMPLPAYKLSMVRESINIRQEFAIWLNDQLTEKGGKEIFFSGNTNDQWASHVLCSNRERPLGDLRGDSSPTWWDGGVEKRLMDKRTWNSCTRRVATSKAPYWKSRGLGDCDSLVNRTCHSYVISKKFSQRTIEVVESIGFRHSVRKCIPKGVQTTCIPEVVRIVCVLAFCFVSIFSEKSKCAWL